MLKAVVVIALVVGGIVVIGNAFPDPAGSGEPGATRTTQSPTPPAQDGQEPPQQQGNGGQKTELVGTLVFIYNSTSVNGLAGRTAKKLEKRFNVEVPQDGCPEGPDCFLGNATARETTEVYFRRPKDREKAEFLARRFFPEGTVAARLPADATADKTAQIVIYLGNDFATA